MKRTLAGRVAILLSGPVAATLIALPCAADVPKSKCIDANARAQDLRHDHKLSQARELLALCADPSCPSLVRSDCEKRLVELEHAQPSVVFDVITTTGGVILTLTMTVDGKPLPGANGGALALDPGTHSVTVEAAGYQPVTRSIVMLEGDKAHHEQIILSPTPPATAVVDTTTKVAGPWLGESQRTIGLVAAGVGVAGLVVGGVFGGLTLAEKSDQQKVCGTTCSAAGHVQALSDHSSGITDSTVSTIGFVAGGVLVAAGATLFFTAGSSETPAHPTSGAIRLVPTLSPSSSGLLAVGQF